MQERMGNASFRMYVRGERGRRVLAANPEMGVPRTENAGDIQTEQQARDVGETIGRYLAELGINLNVAPDVSVGSEKAQSELNGFHRYGVFGMTKYFPATVILKLSGQ